MKALLVPPSAHMSMMQGGMVDGLWVGGSRGDTDFHALAYQIKLLGFNAVRLPFTFNKLKQTGRRQAMECTPNTKSAWAKRATDPKLSPQPEYSVAPDPALYIYIEEWNRDLCNTYVPSNETSLAGERLLWTIQYFIASGFYVVVGGSSRLGLAPHPLVLSITTKVFQKSNRLHAILHGNILWFWLVWRA